ncbi:MAG: alpha/beta fold hydrolase [Labilithrix sp.]|nr:alpha/beta fold hydrolase [Labilithrix sp.]MCW5812043.1 alpha/beta fold hydrolase [Labilithrix sp.]
MGRPYLCLAALVPCLVAACATESDAPAISEDAVLAAESAPIVFEPCGMPPGAPPLAAECANIDVPLDWSSPGGRRINFFVKRIRGSAPGPHKQLWLLQGGPGGSGQAFDFDAPLFAGIDPSFDLYIPDHRGTGRSSLLRCAGLSSPPIDVNACRDDLLRTWGSDGLAAFSTTSAARDVGSVIARTREPGQEVHVYGVSYGTYLAQRYLQVFPRQPTSVTLDGVCQAGLCSLLKYAYWTDHVAQQFMRECAADEVCGAKLGPDPNARMKEALAIADAGTCAGLAGVTGNQVRALMVTFSRMFGYRTFVPPLAYRILRCDAGDVVALQNFAAIVLTPPTAPPMTSPTAPPASTEPPRPFSQALSYNIAFSEMMETPAITRPELEALMSESVFAQYSPAMHDMFDAWPKYDHDEYVGRYPTTDVPVLLLNGTLDAATPIEFAEEVAAHYTRPHQTFVSLPRAVHGTLRGSPTTDGKQCGLELFRQFVTAPTRPLDTSCASRIVPHDFGSNMADAAERWFGTRDLWENPVTPQRKTPARDPELEAELARINDEPAPFF